MQDISSLSEKLLRATQSCASQTERADYLEDQCTLLKEKINDLLMRVAQNEKRQIKTTETHNIAVQTDGTSEAGFFIIQHTPSGSL